MAVLSAFSAPSPPLGAQDLYFDPDESAAGNNEDGTNLGGAGTWGTSAPNWWDGASMIAWPNTSTANAIFTYAFPSAPYAIPLSYDVTVDAGGVTAKRLSFLRSGYTLSGGAITLAGTDAGAFVSLGDSATASSRISGTDGFLKTGGGTLRLTNDANNYTGITTIANGTLMISSAAQLGADTSAIVVTESNPMLTNLELHGFYGGSLFLDGSGGSIDLARDLSLQGGGPISGAAGGERGGALISFGDNTLSGVVRVNDGLNQPSGQERSTRLISNQGVLTISNELALGGTTAHVASLGGLNTAGAGGSFHLTGELSGSAYLHKQGAGTLFFAPSLTENFDGRLRISGSVTGGQSSVRIASATDGSGNSIFGTANGGTTSAPIDMNGGVLELRMESGHAFGKNVYNRASSTYFAGPGVGGSGVNETMGFGAFRFQVNTTATFNSRNGYGLSFGAWTQESSNQQNTITNNMGGTLTFNGNAWNNSDGSARILTIGGNGNTVITGSINTSGAGLKTLTKTGSGALTIQGVATALNGPVNVQGSLVITDFRSIGNNTQAITLGNTTTTAGNLILGTSVAPSVAGLITDRPIVLNTTTASPSIYANQAGANPVVLNGAITRPNHTSGQLILGGTSTADNTVNAAIPAGGTGGITKVGPGTWVLAGANTYTGTTTIANGILKLRANAATSTILPSGNNATFTESNQFAGATLEFVGQDLTNNVQSLGTLTSSAGANTLKLTPGTGGTASLVFANMTTGGAVTLNIVGADFTDNTVTFTQVNGGAGGNGLLSRTVYWNGADYAYRDSTVMRAPVYDTDAGFVTAGAALAAGNNLIVADIADQATHSAVTLKFDGSRNLALDTGATLTLTGAGILATGGASTISGGTALATGTGALVVRVNQDTDFLTIDSVITGSGGLTLSGEGTLILTAANTRTGTTTINEGTIQLSGAGRLGNAAALTIRQRGVYDLNGVTPATNHNAFNNAGRVINSSETLATLTIGGSNGTGTSFGTIEGAINVVKLGTGAQSWLGLNSYTGSTTIGSTGLVTVDHMANIGEDSGIGRGDATDDASNAASLVFDGSTGGLVYAGSIRDGNLILGTQSASTDRLFTMSGSGATLSSTATNNNAIVWSNFGAIVHGTDANRTLVLRGASTGDNTLNPQLTDSTGFVTSLTKTDAGQWNLGNGNNTHTGLTSVENGILALNQSGALPDDSPVVLRPTSATSAAILQTSGVFERDLAATATAGTGTITWDFGIASTTGGAGFAAHTDALVVALGGIASPTALTWGSGGFVGTGGVQNLVLNSTTALSSVDFRNAIDLGNAQRTITVLDNVNTGADFAIMSGVLSGTGGSLRKIGGGNLILTGGNTYTGLTDVQAGALTVHSLGSSTGPASSSLGASGVAMTNANAIHLGNASTSNAILQYVGTGEVSDRKIRINATTGTSAGAQIHADGTGALVLTNVANDLVSNAGVKNLWLRGTSTAGNMITSQLSDNGGPLDVRVDGGATWILTSSANDYSGITLAGGGALGIGHDSALGASTLTMSNGSVFAYGGERTIANVVTQGNGVRAAFIGDHSLTFTNGYTLLQTTSGTMTTVNNLLGDATLNFAAGVTANDLGDNGRVWTIDGGGTTVFGDVFTTTQASRGVLIRKTGDGILELRGDYSSLPGGTFAYNQNNRNLEILRGTVRAGADDILPAFAGHGGLVLAPTEATGSTATFDLNGTSQTINALTATSNGSTVIDNTSSTAAVFRFGANDSAVAFGAGIGSYTIQNSGGGALSLVKLGDTTATFISGLTLAHSGVTASEGGGAFIIASELTATTGLRAIESSTLSLTGGIANPGLITSIEVGGGSTLGLLDGAGSAISNLTTLSLGNTGSGTATLNLNIGDGATDTLTLLGGYSASLGNTITFNLTDAGLSEGTTYTLLQLVDGGIDAFGVGNMIQGATPGGFTSMTWDVTDNLVRITTGDLIIGDIYWRGLSDSTWNANADNWSLDKDGSGLPDSIPGQGNTVIFAWDDPGGGALATTLEQNFKINALVFEAGATTTPSAVTIAPGAVANARLEIKPQNDTDGIELKGGGPGLVGISANLKLGADQTWTVADAAGRLEISGALDGAGALVIAGSGLVQLSSPALPTFAVPSVTIDGGTLEMQSVAALGSAANDNLASIVVNTGGAFFTNIATASTTANAITLAGGTLSAGGATQTYSSTIDVTAASTITMLDPATLANGRNITLSGGLSGNGALTVDSIGTVGGGNQISGTLTLNQDNSAWTGDWNLLRGTISTNNASGLGGGSTITAEKGRILFTGTAGDRTIGHDIVIASATENALLEFNQASGIAMTYTGGVTLGNADHTGELRVLMANDAATATFTGGVLLANNGLIGTQNSANRQLHIDSIISETGGARSLRINDGTWGGTAGTVRLSGLNAFTGDLTVARGILEFDTATNAGGAASSLGQGNLITLGAQASSTLRFIGDGAANSQTTDRGISITSDSATNFVGTLDARGTDGASITYAGAINVSPNADGSWLVLSGLAGSEGFITGGFTQTGVSADVNVNGGTWTLSGTPVTVADDLFVQTPNAVLVLGSTGILTWGASTTNYLDIRNGATLRLGANETIAAGIERLYVGQGGAGEVAILDTNGFTATTPRLYVGGVQDNREGNVIGSGTITVTEETEAGGIVLYRGSVSANLAGAAPIYKAGFSTMILSGDNSGLTSTGTAVTDATRIDAGTLILDFTSDNNNKLPTSRLDLRGGHLILNGSSTAATSQSVNGLTLAGVGAARITVNAGAGQTAVLNLGDIIRGASGGTLRLTLPDGAQTLTNGITTTRANNTTTGLLRSSTENSAAFATVNDGTGTWWATREAGSGARNIVALASTAQNDVGTWLHDTHITDETTGFTGTVNAARLHSLRFDAASGGSVNVSPTGALSVISGGILVTDQVSGGAPGILGGTLVGGGGATASGPNELVFLIDSSQTFVVSADITRNTAITKAGEGTLRLQSMTNNQNGILRLQQGALELAGGNAVGDTTRVLLSTFDYSTLRLLADETIGSLEGGSTTDGLRDIGVTDIGAHTLTINQVTGANRTYAGQLVGTGNLVKEGFGTNTNLNFNNISAAFTGAVVVNGGLFQMSNIGQINAASFTINGNGMLLIDNNGTTSSTTRILDTTPVILNSAAGADATTVRGLWVRNTDNNSIRFETIGDLVFNSGASYLTGEANAGSGNARAGIIAQNFIRNDHATFSVRGRNLGTASTHHNQFRLVAASEAAFIATLLGGGGAAGSATISIVPWAIGETHNETTTGAANMGNSLVTYVAGNGLRPLNLSTEFVDYASGGATSNVRQVVTTNATGLAGRILNALVIHNNNTAASAISITGSGAGQTLTNTSGAFLFTLNTGATASSAHTITLGGFDDGILTPSGEYIFHVVNPSAAANTATLTVQIESELASAADITKSGRGTLILAVANLAGGGAHKTTLNEGILEIGALDHIGGVGGAIVFAGGALRLGAGFGDDLSLRDILFLTGGGTIDTNGVDLALANSLGTGLGGFTKTGSGTLTLNAAANYAGPTVVAEGTLAIGADNATGVGGDLTILGGATLDVGTSSILAGLVTTTGASPQILGAGTIAANRGFLFNHTGDTQIDAALAGAGGLLKLGANVLTLAGASTYSGRTEIHAGTLVFDSIGNVGGGPSALGNPLNAQEGIIRMGLTTGATTLTYTGTGHSSDRLIGIQGTTGSVTLNANGSGAVAYGGVIGMTPNNKTLILRGTSDPAIENQIGGIDQGVIDTLTVTKTDANTWVVAGASNYTGVTQVDNGTLKIGIDDALPTGTTVRLGTGGTAGTLDLNGFDQTVASFLVQTNSTTLTNTLVVADGNTFTVDGPVTIGANATTSTTLFVASGGGAFVNNNTGGTFQVGGSTASYNAATADFSGLASFTVDLGATGTMRIGDNSSATGATGGASTLILAEDNVITAGLLQVSGLQPQTPQTLRLGSGTNQLNVDVLSVGSNWRGSGTIDFAGATGSVVLRAADGTGRAEVRMAAHTVATNANNNNNIDLAGHDADLLISTLTLVDRSGSGTPAGPDNQSAGYATFSFDRGTLDAENVVLARRTGTGTGNATATLNLGGGTVLLGSVTMAVNTSAGGEVEANLNVTGGDVAIGTGSGTAINMANAAASRTATSNLNLTGGTVTVTGNIVRQGGAGTENATVTLDGATLDLSGNSIGTGAAPIVLTAQSGILRNLAELNGGGNLVKTGAGTLVLEGANAYTGRTVVNGGVLSIDAEERLGLAPAAPAADHLEIDGGALRATASFALDDANRGITIGSSGGILDIDAGASLSIENAVVLGGELEKTGAGTLLWNGNSSGAGPVKISAGTLGGSGTVAAATAVESGAFLGAGTGGAVGTLSFAEDLTTASGSTWLIDIVQDQNGISDLISVGGALSLGGATLSLNQIGVDPFTPNTNFVWTIATFNQAAGLTGTFADLDEGATVSDNFIISYGIHTAGAITLTAVPEPGTLGLLGLGLGGLVMRRLRRRRAEGRK